MDLPHARYRSPRRKFINGLLILEIKENEGLESRIRRRSGWVVRDKILCSLPFETVPLTGICRYCFFGIPFSVYQT